MPSGIYNRKDKKIHERQYSDTEIAYLRENYHISPAQEIADILNRSYSSVRVRAAKLGLKSFKFTRCISSSLDRKICAACDLEKDKEDFGLDKQRKDGRYPHCKTCCSENRDKRKPKKKEYDKIYVKNLRPNQLVNRSCRKRFKEVLRQTGKYASKKFREIIGCSQEFLVGYLAAKFKIGMTWENYGEWHIDHIIACKKFDLNNEAEVRRCFHYTNLQPLWAAENLSKGDR